MIVEQLKTPILLIAFNRIDSLKVVFAKIRQVQPTRFYVAIDGPRASKGIKEVTLVNEVIEYIKNSVDWACQVNYLIRKENLGCKLGVSQAITWFFEHEESGIILEDDCVPDLSFFYFCQELLELYQNSENVMMISGDQFSKNGIQAATDSSYYFSHLPHIWGWASWRRAWKQYDLSVSDWPKNIEIIKQNAELPEYIWKLFKENFSLTQANKIDTWDYQWVYSIWKSKGLVISPKVNLISNIGFGNEATHTTNPESIFSKMPVNPISFPLLHPEEMIRNREQESKSYPIVFPTSSSSAIIRFIKNPSICKRLLRLFSRKPGAKPRG